MPHARKLPRTADDHSASASAESAVIARAIADFPEPHARRRTTEELTNPLLIWLNEQGRFRAAQRLDQLLKLADTLATDLNPLIQFTFGQDVLAFTLLSEYARERALHVGELSTLLTDPVATARAAVRCLMEASDEVIIDVARLTRSLDIHRRARAGELAERRDRGQVLRLDD
jgi:hypothetical protein